MKTKKFHLLAIFFGVLLISACTKNQEGCTDPFAINFDGQATENNGDCVYANDIRGCTNPNSVNFNPQATINDGSCIIEGCTDPKSENYNPEATQDNGSCIDVREKFAGTWQVTSNCGIQFSLAQEQIISFPTQVEDSIYIQPFLAFGNSPVSGYVRQDSIFLTEQTAGAGLVTFSAAGSINSNRNQITLVIEYANIFGTNQCTATFTKP